MTTEMTIPEDIWLKSSYSQSNGGECIEWAPAHSATTGVVPVRDSKNPSGPALAFTASAWSAFVAGVKAEEFGV